MIQEQIEALAASLFSDKKQEVLAKIYAGTFNLDEFVEGQTEYIQRHLTENWSSYVDTTNPYWNLADVSPSDMKFLMGRIMHDLCIKLPEFIRQEMQETYTALQKEYKNVLNEMKNLFVSFCERGDTAQLEELTEFQSLTFKLQAIASKIEKTRLFFTAQQLKIEEINLLINHDLHDVKINEISSLQMTKETTIREPIPSALEVPSQQPTPTVADHEEKITSSKPKTNTDGELEAEVGTIHTFERSLVNGFVNTVKHGPTLVPESHIREKGFEHGDKLRVASVKQNGDQVQYEFELAEKGPSVPNNRIQHNMCIVEKDEKGYFVQKSLNGLTVDSQGNPFQFRLKEHDISRLKIDEGDIVDIAFRPKDPSSVRVVWKHYIAGRATSSSR
jgi:hypothetical protein